MSKPFIHAQSNVKRYGGHTDDYLPLHNFMDSSKQVIGDNRHRCLFHHTFGIFILEKLFGHNESKLQVLKEKYKLSDEAIKDIRAYADFVRTSDCTTITNSDGKEVSVRDIGESHCLEDFGGKFIPSAQDYIDKMDLTDWMNNGAGNDMPNSYKKLEKFRREKFNLKPLQQID